MAQIISMWASSSRTDIRQQTGPLFYRAWNNAGINTEWKQTNSPSGPPNWLIINEAVLGQQVLILTGNWKPFFIVPH